MIDSQPGEIKENIINSTDIFNLLANLYMLCSTRFAVIYAFVKNNQEYGAEFRDYLLRYKLELLEIGDSIFSADVLSIVSVIKDLKEYDEAEFLVGIWAYFRAIDLFVSDEKVFLNTLTPRRCKASAYFGEKEFLLLFKPRNLIFDSIKENAPGDEIKTGFDIGQRIEDHLHNLIFYEEHLGRKIKIEKMDSIVDELLSNQGKNLAFAVAPLHLDYRYSFKAFGHEDGVPYVFSDINNKATIGDAVHYVLGECLEKDVHIVVFPELSIDRELRQSISDWLRLNNSNKTIIFVVAGSWHTATDEAGEIYKNSSIVFRFDGEVLWEQEKMNQFQLDEKDIKRLRASSLSGFEEFKKLFKSSDKKGWEKIVISNPLAIYDSVIGRMAITICLDYFVREKNKLLVEPNVNIIFVPTMSFTLDRMERTNFEMGAFGLASVFCANSCWIITGGEIDEFKDVHSSYIYVPQKGGMMQMPCSGDCFKCGLKIFRVSEIF
jgi:hypothetical protein